ncbi:uncharacterized protein LOC119589445, partial [Penaeus monodon]|uniref:uncharacterized protein LOC119589445 n=1 Tax=Penaeus monodon TaxID=6687 RepID=UPI0018A75B78
MRRGADQKGRRQSRRRVTEEKQTSNKDAIFSHGAAWNSGGEFRVILLGLLLVFSLAASEAKGPAELVETMASWTARLPCRVKNVDTPLLVLWYRRHENHPFYSYDARTGNISSGD